MIELSDSLEVGDDVDKFEENKLHQSDVQLDIIDLMIDNKQEISEENCERNLENRQDEIEENQSESKREFRQQQTILDHVILDHENGKISMYNTLANISVQLPVPASFIAAKCGGKILVAPDGYQFRKQSKYQMRTFYRCCRRIKDGCRVSAAVTNSDQMLVRITGQHNHHPGLLRNLVKELTNSAIEEAVANPPLLARDVLANISNKLENVSSDKPFLTSLPSIQTLSRQIQRKRQRALNIKNNSL